MHPGGALMLWTVFKLLFVVWMLQMVLHFGESAIQVVLVVSVTALLLRLIVRRAFFSSGRLRRVHEDRKVQLHLAEQFAGASKINSSFHNRI
jgi:hypothetical protein